MALFRQREVTVCWNRKEKWMSVSQSLTKDNFVWDHHPDFPRVWNSRYGENICFWIVKKLWNTFKEFHSVHAIFEMFYWEWFKEKALSYLSHIRRGIFNCLQLFQVFPIVTKTTSTIIFWLLLLQTWM